jgi:hypothetical protein
MTTIKTIMVLGCNFIIFHGVLLPPLANFFENKARGEPCTAPHRRFPCHPGKEKYSIFPVLDRIEWEKNSVARIP